MTSPKLTLTTALIIPTLNAGKEIAALFSAIAKQTRQPDHVLVIDSSSTDNTRELLAQLSVKTHVIPKSDFDHGGTRQLATQLVDADIYLFLTQDAIPAHAECFENLITALLSQDNIGCAYGKQLPKSDATPLSKHARLYNYSSTSHVMHYADKNKYGIKTCFNSNSFAAYKKTILQQAGGFPTRLIMGEDVYVAGKMLLKGYAISYVANACVYHSHNFNLLAEFKRYFSIGTFHRQANWILHEFGTANNEGFKFIFSEIKFLIRNRKIHWIPRAFASTFIKFFAYKLGLRS